VVGSLDDRKEITPASLYPFGYNYSVQLDKWNISDQACDYLFIGDQKIDFEIPGTLSLIYNFGNAKAFEGKDHCYPLFSLEEFLHAEKKSTDLNFVSVKLDDVISKHDATVFGDSAVVMVFE